MEERRKSERYTIRLPVRIEVADSKQQKEAFDLLTSNVSEGGTFIPSQKPIPKGTRVQIRLVLINEVVKEVADAQGCIMASGTVVRSGSTGMAICFDKEYLHKKMDPFHAPSYIY